MRIYDNEMMRAIVDSSWYDNQGIIRRYCFYPWLLYTLCVIVTFNMYLKYEDPNVNHDYWGKTFFEVGFGILTLLLIA